MPALYQSLGVYLPLITTNCAVLGVALTNVTKEYGILESVVNGFATAFGFLIAIRSDGRYCVKKLNTMIFQNHFRVLRSYLITACFDVYRVYGILRNDLGGKNKMNVYRQLLVAAVVVGGVGTLYWIFPRRFRRKIQSRS